MLVLTRKLGQDIILQLPSEMGSHHVLEDIVITVAEIKHGAVRIGIRAPNYINIVRRELLDGSHPVNPADFKKQRFKDRTYHAG